MQTTILGTKDLIWNETEFMPSRNFYNLEILLIWQSEVAQMLYWMYKQSTWVVEKGNHWQRVGRQLEEA